jgi:uncharacterized tellurite resistance protein B-like protein
MFNLFRKKQEKNETKAMLAGLYKFMMADDHTSNEESHYFWNKCREKGLDKDDIEDMILNCTRYSQSFPKDKEKQKLLLAEMQAMMKADGAIKPGEVELLKKYAACMGLPESDIPL